MPTKAWGLGPRSGHMKLDRRQLLFASAATLAVGCTPEPPLASPPTERDIPMDWKRVERVHWMSGGKQLLASHPEHLTAFERAECPPELIAAFMGWPADSSSRTWALFELPETLEWARDSLRARRPVLERSQHDDRVYWSIRYPLRGDPKFVQSSCIGSSTGGVPSKAPGTLGWLARTFGHVDLCSEWSGTAPWGKRLGQVAPASFVEFMLPELPKGAADWWAVHEADGDWLALNAEGALVWIGPEWTGEVQTPIAAPIERVLSFQLWRFMDGGSLLPSDLKMLGR